MFGVFMVFVVMIIMLNYWRNIWNVWISTCRWMMRLGTTPLEINVRKLCSHLRLSGETQQIDRLLYEFSKRYWQSNSDLHVIFKSAGILCIMASNRRYRIRNRILARSLKHRSTYREFGT
jgi:hypothetical protein